MRQLVANSDGVTVQAVPSPTVQPGQVLVRVAFSTVSIGTELAALRPPAPDGSPAAIVARTAAQASLLQARLRFAWSNPGKALIRAQEILRDRLARAIPAPAPPAPTAPAAAADSAEATPAPPAGIRGWGLGYSAAGEVVAVGEGVRDLVPGTRVACAGAGYASHADIVSVPRNLVSRVPEGCDLRVASTTTLGAIALQGVRRGQPQLGETAYVVGLGLIGQLAAQMLRANGCRVIVLDPVEERVSRAIQLGAHAGATEPAQVRSLVRDLTQGRGVDLTLICAAASSSEVVHLAAELTRAKGRLVVVGDVGLHLERAAIYRKEIDVLISTSYGPGRYDPAYEEQGHDYPYGHVRWTANRNMQAYLDLVAAGGIRVEPLIDRVVPVDEAHELYEELRHARPGPLGVVLQYSPPDGAGSGSPVVEIGPQRQPEAGVTEYALVGMGAFGTAMLVPQLERLGDRFRLRAVVSRRTVEAGNFATTHRAPVLATDLQPVLEDPRVTLAVIATRHHEHAEQVSRALAAGRHVFVEKPLAIDWVGLQRVCDAVRLRPEPLLMVGFNRRFSPAATALAAALEGRRSPLVMCYRVNAGYLPPEHWVQGPQGGGRNVGEACHMYDLFRFLAAAPVASVSAAAIDPGALAHSRSENFSATLGYRDGSVATLVYTSLGPKGLAKERLEVFADGEAFLLDDYTSLTRASDGHVLWRSSEPDKGHAAGLAKLGEAIASGGSSPTPFEEVVETTTAALTIEDLIHGLLG